MRVECEGGRCWTIEWASLPANATGGGGEGAAIGKGWNLNIADVKGRGC